MSMRAASARQRAGGGEAGARPARPCAGAGRATAGLRPTRQSPNGRAATRCAAGRTRFTRRGTCRTRMARTAPACRRAAGAAGAGQRRQFGHLGHSPQPASGAGGAARSPHLPLAHAHVAAPPFLPWAWAQAIFEALEAVRHRDWFAACGTQVLLYRGAWQVGALCVQSCGPAHSRAAGRSYARVMRPCMLLPQQGCCACSIPARCPDMPRRCAACRSGSRGRLTWLCRSAPGSCSRRCGGGAQQCSRESDGLPARLVCVFAPAASCASMPHTQLCFLSGGCHL